jgi:tripartite-type tricarboxylate transporter receptor subunit TctC
MQKPRRIFIAIAGVTLACLGLPSPGLAQSFPSKPVSLMVPYPAGGLSDVLARMVNPPLSKQLGQPVIVENVGGVSGAIAAQKVLSAPVTATMFFRARPTS